MNEISIPRELAEAIGEYLSHRPYREVAQLLAELGVRLQQQQQGAAPPSDKKG